MTTAEKMIHAIDLRIDAIYAEFHRVMPTAYPSDPEVMVSENIDAGTDWWGRAHRARPDLLHFISNAFGRRDEWVQVRDTDERKAQEAEFKEYRRNLAWGDAQPALERCEHCGSMYRAAA